MSGDGIHDIITGMDVGGSSEVRVFDGIDGSLRGSHEVFDPPDFMGGVRVAAGDFDGDGLADVVVGAGPGGTPTVGVFSGLFNSVLLSGYAYELDFTGGVYVAAGDVIGDGLADLITGAGAGHDPLVNVFSGADGSLIHSFLAYDSSFLGGVRVAAEDVSGDGIADIITGKGPGGNPEVAVFDGVDLTEIDRFFAYEPEFDGGVFVAG